MTASSAWPETPGAGSPGPGPDVRRRWGALAILPVLLVLLPVPAPAGGQEPDRGGHEVNIALPTDSLEHLLQHASFEVKQIEDNRFRGDRTQNAVLGFRDGPEVRVKWAQAPRGGDAFNNHPRYELAAYRLQKLFLEEGEYVVPPTVVRCIPLWRYRGIDSSARPTFGGERFVVTVLQYWLENVAEGEEIFHEGRVAWDTAYARRAGQLNVFTYLANHKDSNRGNVLISRNAHRPRFFAVDNGLTFGSDESDRGEEWRELRVDRLPSETVAELRGIDREDLQRTLGVVAQFEQRGSDMVPVPATENLDPDDGVRRRGNVLQLGLTRREIRNVHRRIRDLLKRVDRGEIETF